LLIVLAALFGVAVSVAVLAYVGGRVLRTEPPPLSPLTTTRGHVRVLRKWRRDG